STHNARLGLTAQSRVLQYASLNFDASLWDMAMAWGAGAALVLMKEDERSGSAIRDVVARTGASHALLPPALLASLSEGEEPALDVLLVGGEACRGEVVERYSKGRRMVNAYGPTETTVCATIGAPMSGAGVPALGRPVSNTRVYVLD